MAVHNLLGEEGERVAFTLMEQKGYRILEKNWRYKQLEVDLIVTNRREIIFVEVKTRTSSFIVSPLESVDRSKQSHIIRAANIYVRMHRIALPIRFDIVTAIYIPSQGVFETKHYLNAFGVRPKTY
ncbi:YraN family protein [Porphyromonas gingivicanis]|uniref:YraN family protein n=1 Tax=Porphyromonas gingivicanis TaxID=266762 RepID=UPI0004706427|nr:YraN family protein [Porphyromonas gingivicanis]